MNKESIIAMAKECGLLDINYEIGEWDIHEVTSFADLIATAERNHCSARADIALLGADRALRDRVLKAINIRKPT